MGGMSAAGMDVRNVESMSKPAMRAVLLCCGDCSGGEIDMPVRQEQWDSSRRHACALEDGVEWKLVDHPSAIELDGRAEIPL